jgi:hypothetical protein
LVSDPLKDPYEKVERRKRGLFMRSEQDGGMLWDPRTGAVYKLDEEAYHALLDLENGFSEREVAKRMGINIRLVQSLSRNVSKILSKTMASPK